jgi:uncharacterized protein (TIGR03435 family)
MSWLPPSSGRTVRAVIIAAAQAPASPAFDVVSIRANKPSASSDPLASLLQGGVRLVGDHLQATNINAHALVHAAYRSEFTDGDQIAGADGWITAERFDVEARAPTVLAETPTFPPFPPAAELMLRQALQQRFQLRVRRETRELPRLVLTYANADRSLKKGIRLSKQNCRIGKPQLEGDCAYRPGAGKYSVKGQPINDLVDYLSIPAYGGGRVVDGTGITANLDIDLQWMLNFGDLLASRANLTTALQEQLGLKLESRRLPLPVLVIEHIERPSEN